MAVTGLAAQPRLPPGERIELPGRGTTFVRILRRSARRPHRASSCTAGSPAAGLNWFTAFGPAVAALPRDRARHARPRTRHPVVGGASGWPTAPTTWPRCSTISTPSPAIVVGLLDGRSDRAAAVAPPPGSGGGPRALRHRPIGSCAGLGSGSSSASMMATAAGTTRAGALLEPGPAGLRMRGWAPVSARARPTSLRTWAAGEMRRHDAVKLMEAGQAIGSYNARRWIGEIDVPTTVMVTERDRAIDPRGAAQDGGRHPGRRGPAARRRARGLRQARVRPRPRAGRRLRRCPHPTRARRRAAAR